MSLNKQNFYIFCCLLHLYQLDKNKQYSYKIFLLNGKHTFQAVMVFNCDVYFKEIMHLRQALVQQYVVL